MEAQASLSSPPQLRQPWCPPPEAPANLAQRPGCAVEEEGCPGFPPPALMGVPWLRRLPRSNGPVPLGQVDILLK